MASLAKSEFRESTKPLLRPSQVVELTGEKDRLHRMLTAPEYIRNQLQDKSGAIRTIRNADKILAEQAPSPYQGKQLDSARAREAQLRAEIEAGMPTKQEMRRNPSGARDKHMLWERRNKTKLQEWKNIRLRMHASGALPQYTEFSNDVANFEQFRKMSGGTGELAMENCQIEGKHMHGIDTAEVGVAVMTDEDVDMLRRVDPEISDTIATMSNEKRQIVREFVRNLIAREQGLGLAAEPMGDDDVMPEGGSVEIASQRDEDVPDEDEAEYDDVVDLE